MSGKIDDKRSALPWNDEALRSVREVRSAVTELRSDPVDDDVAPFMGEFLARPEEWVGAENESDLVPPPPPDPSRPIDPRRVVAEVERLRGEVTDMIASHPEEAPRLQKMLAVLERYSQMKHEIVLRADAGSSA